MQQITRTTTLTLIGFAALGLSALAQEAAGPQAEPAAASQAKTARRQATQRLTADFSAAMKNGSLSPDDQQKAQTALTQLQPHAKHAPRDPQARHQAMQTLKQMSANPALKPEDRDLLAKDFAALKPNRARKN